MYLPLAKSFLILLRLTAATSATDVAIHKKMFGSGTSTLIIFKILTISFFLFFFLTKNLH